MFRWIGLLLLLLVIAAATPMAKRPITREIPRFCMVSGGIYRGGQPTLEGFQFLKKQGIKTVINLRAEDNSEAVAVENLGMKYVQIPVPEIRPWTRIPEGAIQQYLEVVSNPANYPIFFHCRRGADRTGAVAAVYRMAVQHWDAQKAYGEARSLGMRWFYAGLKSQIFGFKP
jgi:protein tyrosine/serine phosphatase